MWNHTWKCALCSSELINKGNCCGIERGLGGFCIVIMKIIRDKIIEEDEGFYQTLKRTKNIFSLF